MPPVAGWRPGSVGALIVTASLSLGVAASASSGAATRRPSPGRRRPPPSSGVVDGDTIVVDRGRGEEHIRYIGVDTPETVHPSKPVQAFGARGVGGEPRARRGPPGGPRARHQRGRPLRPTPPLLWLPDGSTSSFVNLELVKRGYAQVVTYPPDVKYVDLFLAAQREARAAGRGLWGVTPDTSPSPSPHASPVASPRGCDPAYPSVCIPPPPPDRHLRRHSLPSLRGPATGSAPILWQSRRRGGS